MYMNFIISIYVDTHMYVLCYISVAPQVYFNKSSSCSLQQLVFTFHTNTESYKCTLSINGIMAPNTEMMSDHELAYMVENISSNNNNTFECTPTDGRGICNPSNNGTMIP